jgi:thioredoxin reductase (NADPH)
MPPPRPIVDTRRDQMFPVLDPEDMERVSRFGQVRTYKSGEALFRVGQVSPGLVLVLSGRIDVTQHDESGRRTLIVTHGGAGSWGNSPSSPIALRSWMPMRVNRSKR